MNRRTHRKICLSTSGGKVLLNNIPKKHKLYRGMWIDLTKSKLNFSQTEDPTKLADEWYTKKRIILQQKKVKIAKKVKYMNKQIRKGKANSP